MFDEEWYLSYYPDVAEAVTAGTIDSALAHYERYGRVEQRLPTRFNESFYLSRYPVAVAEIAAGKARDALSHYEKLGMARGYLPNLQAARPDNAAASRSRFGGLWLDAVNATDLVEGKHDIGLITAEERDRLLFFVHNGFLVIPSAIDQGDLDRAEQTLDDIYAGKYPDIQFECFRVTNTTRSWLPEMNEHPAKALDAHMFSSALRDVIFNSKLTRMLGLIFDSKPLASQTLTFLRGSAQEAHQDSAYVPYSLPRIFAASWIALEDVSENAGELFYYPGSHRFEEFLYADKKSVWEAKRSGLEEAAADAEVRRHVAILPKKAEARNMTTVPFLAKRGDALIWHPELVHGGSPVSKNVTRKSIVTHYCPRFNIPLFAEAASLKQFEHPNGMFMSGIYPKLQPRD